MSKQDKATTERHTKTLRELVRKPDNKSCADCKRNDPRWASWNLGVFICIRCSGIHRSMGTHISKVKSVDLDTWTPEQMASIQKWGNKRANLYWEAHLKQGHVPPDHKIESFIRSKYESRRWAMEGPPPSDPSALEGTADDSIQEQAAAAEPQSPAQQPQSPVAQPRQPAPSRTAHPLLSTSLMSSNRTQPQQAAVAASRSPPLPAAPPATTPPVQAPAPQDDLFSLDFNSSSGPSATASVQPKKDVKNDIMSLFGSAASQPASNTWGGNAWGAPAAQQAPPSADPWGSFSSAAPVAPAAPPAFSGIQQSFGQPQQQSFPAFGQNVWATTGTSTQATAADPWAGFGTTTTSNTTSQPAAAKKDDPFANLWG